MRFLAKGGQTLGKGFTVPGLRIVTPHGHFTDPPVGHAPQHQTLNVPAAIPHVQYLGALGLLETQRGALLFGTQEGPEIGPRLCEGGYLVGGYARCNGGEKRKRNGSTGRVTTTTAAGLSSHVDLQENWIRKTNNFNF